MQEVAVAEPPGRPAETFLRPVSADALARALDVIEKTVSRTIAPKTPSSAEQVDALSTLHSALLSPNNELRAQLEAGIASLAGNKLFPGVWEPGDFHEQMSERADAVRVLFVFEQTWVELVGSLKHKFAAAYRNDPDPACRALALWYSAELASDTLQFCAAALHDEDLRVRRVAVVTVSLRSIGAFHLRREVGRFFSDAVKNKDHETAIRAASYLNAPVFGDQRLEPLPHVKAEPDCAAALGSLLGTARVTQDGSEVFWALRAMDGLGPHASATEDELIDTLKALAEWDADEEEPNSAAWDFHAVAICQVLKLLGEIGSSASHRTRRFLEELSIAEGWYTASSHTLLEELRPRIVAALVQVDPSQYAKWERYLWLHSSFFTENLHDEEIVEWWNDTWGGRLQGAVASRALICGAPPHLRNSVLLKLVKGGSSLQFMPALLGHEEGTATTPIVNELAANVPRKAGDLDVSGVEGTDVEQAVFVWARSRDPAIRERMANYVVRVCESPADNEFLYYRRIRAFAGFRRMAHSKAFHIKHAARLVRAVTVGEHEAGSAVACLSALDLIEEPTDELVEAVIALLRRRFEEDPLNCADAALRLFRRWGLPSASDKSDLLAQLPLEYRKGFSDQLEPTIGEPPGPVRTSEGSWSTSRVRAARWFGHAWRRRRLCRALSHEGF